MNIEYKANDGQCRWLDATGQGGGAITSLVPYLCTLRSLVQSAIMKPCGNIIGNAATAEWQGF